MEWGGLGGADEKEAIFQINQIAVRNVLVNNTLSVNYYPKIAMKEPSKIAGCNLIYL